MSVLMRLDFKAGRKARGDHLTAFWLRSGEKAF